MLLSIWMTVTAHWVIISLLELLIIFTQILISLLFRYWSKVHRIRRQRLLSLPQGSDRALARINVPHPC